MDIFTAIATFVIFWWISLFLTFPIGVTTQAETGEIVKGSAKSAPSSIDWKKKLFVASIVAAVLWVTFFVLILLNIIKL